MNRIDRIPTAQERIACVTLDFELDYGDRLEEFNILENCGEEIRWLMELVVRLGVPVSAFVRTDILARYPRSVDMLRTLAGDFHSHSHTHNTRDFDTRRELTDSVAAFQEHFGQMPLGYRAPQGVLRPGDVDLIRKAGFQFSSSVFPSYRPGKFNNLRMPIRPFLYSNGLMELPLAVIPKVRWIVSLSYLKVLGFAGFRALHSLFGLPNIVIFNSHLHDFIFCRRSFDRLPAKVRLLWGIRAREGKNYFERFIQLLRESGYHFVSMSELYHRLAGS